MAIIPGIINNKNPKNIITELITLATIIEITLGATKLKATWKSQLKEFK